MDRSLALDRSKAGIAQGVACYVVWGFLPLFFHLLRRVDAIEILAHRIVWSLLIVLAILAVRGGMRTWARQLRAPSILGVMTISASLIAVNWLAYIWATTHGHVVAASLGYFLTPLVNLLLGLVVLKERLGRLQWLAVGIAALGVSIMAASAPTGLWISVVLALSFGGYGLARKLVPLGSLDGLAAETLILTPLMLAYLAWSWQRGTIAFGPDPALDGLLMFSAVLTSVPLLLFAAAARALPLSVLGLLQYIAPTLQFLVGVALLGETVTPLRLGCFALIWIGLAIFSVHALRARRPAGPAR